MSRETTPFKYSGWISDDRSFREQLRGGFAGMVFGNRASMLRMLSGESNPMRVTIVVHRPKISAEQLKRRRRERMAKINRKRKETV